MLKLYSYFRSSASFRARIALNIKQLAYEIVPIHLVKNGGEQHSESYRQINPLELVPSLIDQGHVITQSLAIMEYLEEMYPTPSLFPTDPFARAQARAFAQTVASEIQPLTNLRVLHYLTNDVAVSEEEKNTWYHHWMAIGLNALEQSLKQLAKPADKCCFGNEPTVADICLIPQLAGARRFNFPIENYPRLLAIEQHCLTLPAFIKALPSNQPDAE